MKFKEVYFHTVAIACGVGFLLGFSGIAEAGQIYHKRGTIVSTQPFYKSVTRQIPSQSCSTVDVPIVKRSGGGDNIGSLIIGGLIGSAVGNQVSGADGAGAVGAIIGGAIANEHQKKHSGTDEVVGYRQENRCTTTYHSETYEELNYTKITVDLGNGLTYTYNTKRNVNVGDTVRLRVEIHHTD